MSEAPSSETRLTPELPVGLEEPRHEADGGGNVVAEDGIAPVIGGLAEADADQGRDGVAVDRSRSRKAGELGDFGGEQPEFAAGGAEQMLTRIGSDGDPGRGHAGRRATRRARRR